jgi:hypothetical protein
LFFHQSPDKFQWCPGHFDTPSLSFTPLLPIAPRTARSTGVRQTQMWGL